MEGVNDELSGNPLNSFCGAAVVLVEERRSTAPSPLRPPWSQGAGAGGQGQVLQLHNSVSADSPAAEQLQTYLLQWVGETMHSEAILGFIKT